MRTRERFALAMWKTASQTITRQWAPQAEERIKETVSPKKQTNVAMHKLQFRISPTAQILLPNFIKAKNLHS
jgi:stalled ribosome rescue protein Dom34